MNGHNTLPAVVPGVDLLVVIDHHEAKIFRTETPGSVPQHLTPYDPHGFGRTLHNGQDDGNGKRKASPKAFYEAVAKTLHGAQQILIFGPGTGSTAMAELLADLKKNHHELAERVIGSVSIDEHHTTEKQLLSKAKELFKAA